jgi:hypothetical protein
MQRFGRFQGQGGHGASIENPLLLTHSDTSRPSITALRKVYSITYRITDEITNLI